MASTRQGPVLCRQAEEPEMQSKDKRGLAPAPGMGASLSLAHPPTGARRPPESPGRLGVLASSPVAWEHLGGGARGLPERACQQGRLDAGDLATPVRERALLAASSPGPTGCEGPGDPGQAGPRVEPERQSRAPHLEQDRPAEAPSPLTPVWRTGNLQSYNKRHLGGPACLREDSSPTHCAETRSYEIYLLGGN